MRKAIAILFFLTFFSCLAQEEETVVERILGNNEAAGEEVLELDSVKEVISYPSLPEWTEEETERASAGKLSASSFLLQDYQHDPNEAQFYQVPESERISAMELDLADEFLEDGEHQAIPTEMISKYFGQRPDRYLEDPQQLLSQQEYLDRIAFLDYHEGDSAIPIYLMIFDRYQTVPDGMQAVEILSSYFKAEEPVVLAYYFLGNPDRSQIALSDSISDAISDGERLRMIRSCIDEAIEKSDSIAQLERFSVQLSIRLYWIEKSMGLTKGEGDADTISAQEAPVKESEELVKLTNKLTSKEVVNALIGGAILLATAICAYFARVRALKKRKYRLLFTEIQPRLGAEHAAGVGSVISFGSHVLPPSEQKEEVGIGVDHS